MTCRCETADIGIVCVEVTCPEHGRCYICGGTYKVDDEVCLFCREDEQRAHEEAHQRWGL